jgi:hypothetical protein
MRPKLAARLMPQDAHCEQVVAEDLSPKPAALPKLEAEAIAQISPSFG